RVARHLRMRGKKGRKLRIVAAYVILIRQQCWIVRDDGGQRGAQPQQLDELALRGGYFLIVWRGCGSSGRRGIRFGCVRLHGDGGGRKGRKSKAGGEKCAADWHGLVLLGVNGGEARLFTQRT